MSGFWRAFLAAFTGQVPSRRLPADEQLRADLRAISEWCYGIAVKAEQQGNVPLADTAPRVAEEIGRALIGQPLAYARHEPDPDVEELLTWLRDRNRDAP